jgi:hypothetical protein
MGKKKTLSMNEMAATTSEEKEVKKSKPPKYWVKRPDFYCPLAPTIMWHHGMIYAECPLVPGERDMGHCANCELRGEKKKARKKKKFRNKNNTPHVDKRKKEPVPNIGKTYVSE